MTIDEAIAQLKDLRKDREGFLKNDEPDSELAKDIEAIDVAVKALEENSKLKRLLRLAVEEMTKQKLYADLGMMSRGALCKSCKTRSVTNRVCQVCNYEYEHAEEALKLIGDDKQ